MQDRHFPVVTAVSAIVRPNGGRVRCGLRGLDGQKEEGMEGQQ